jgi:hypothetical protein
VTATIPPRPNPRTGEPRPPQAPRFTAFGELPRRSAKLARYPQAPEGRGPVLEWYHGTIDSIWMSSLFVSALCFVIITLKDWGFGWMDTWQLWALVLAPAPIWAVWQLLVDRWGISAGADWLAIKSGYVDLYELTEVKVVGTSGGLSWDLELTDKKGTELWLDAKELQANQALWDLVYNGIRYSVQRGSAKTNPRALDKLRLR